MYARRLVEHGEMMWSIYSMTVASTLAIGDPSDRACVEIFDPHQLVRRVRDSVRRHRRARAETLIHDTVRYWSSENPPEEVWAFAQSADDAQARDYKRQCEYRFAFGIRATVFDFENVECFVVDKDTRWPRVRLDPQAHRMKLHLGPLEDCCRFTK